MEFKINITKKEFPNLCRNEIESLEFISNHGFDFDFEPFDRIFTLKSDSKMVKFDDLKHFSFFLRALADLEMSASSVSENEFEVASW